jgi:HEPN domain-containing protein
MMQAKKDLQSARNSLASEDFEWACFQAQQSAEKALKAVLYGRGMRRIITHSVFELIRARSSSRPSLRASISEALCWPFSPEAVEGACLSLHG